MSKFHVVRYDFTVTYGLDDCQVSFSPACDPASISINGDSFQIVPSGGALDITIEDTLGNDPIVSIVGDVVTVAASISPVYDLYFDGIDTGQDITFDGTDVTINLI